MVIARISGFLVKRLMIDQGSGVDGLGLKREDLLKYDTPLVGFDSRVVIP